MAHTLFALQLFGGMPESASIQREIAAAVHHAPAGAQPGGKTAFYTQLAERLRQNAHVFDRWVWDYIPEHERAMEEYQSWTQGTVKDALEAQSAASQGPYRQERRYFFVTLLFLLGAGSAADKYLRAICDIPEDQLFTRQTLHSLLNAIPHLNFSGVRSDALYVRPGTNGAGGVTLEELGQEHYEYLKPLQ